MRAAVIIPAYQVAPVVGALAAEVLERWPPAAVMVVDDGSSDGTAEEAERAGARVLRHPENRGKGAALRTGLREAERLGYDVAVTVDGDGQHPPEEALRMHQACSDPEALVIGVRDLAGAGAPRANQLSNRFSNLVLSAFTGRRLADTQCGLRRYPIAATLALGCQEDGYGFEAEVLIRAIARRMPIFELPIRVIYPPEDERITHFHSVRDPTRIVLRVVRTVLATRAEQLRELVRGTALMAALRKRRRLLIALLVLALSPLVLHGLVLVTTVMRPPPLDLPDATVTVAADDPGRRELGAAYARKRGAINEVRLVGSPAELGAANVRLLYDDQVHIESDLHAEFAHFVPWAAARTLIVDMARLRFRNLDETLGDDYRQEIAAQAAAFQPDPFTDLMGTYQRFVFLHSLYDIMLSFERSPLVGCTSFVLNAGAGHTLLGRNFDFEGPQVLDDRKAVFLVHEDGHIPYASVSWPGFIGSASGMNYEGLAIVIHGARAGETRAFGEPVAQTVRELLASARTTREAVAMLASRSPMVSHMLFIVDALGDAVVAERVPGRGLYVRSAEGPNIPLTNHLEGPCAGDPKNHAVMAATSTLARRRRLDELLQNVVGDADVQTAVRILRDKRGAGNRELPLGNRSAIDALIATHSVVMDTKERVLWVNEGPHITGRFVRFDLRELLDPAYRPNGPAIVETLPSDDIVADGKYDAWVESGSPHLGTE